jgi:hypothetical protein
VAQTVVLYNDPLFLGPFSGELGADAGQFGARSAVNTDCCATNAARNSSRSAKDATAKIIGHYIQRFSSVSPHQ